jgi:hypothetical protein
MEDKIIVPVHSQLVRTHSSGRCIYLLLHHERFDYVES